LVVRVTTVRFLAPQPIIFSSPFPIYNSLPYRAGGSSSGRTPAFGAGYLGSIPSPPATFLWPPRYLFQRPQIDHESKVNVALQDSLVGFVHVLNQSLQYRTQSGAWRRSRASLGFLGCHQLPTRRCGGDAESVERVPAASAYPEHPRESRCRRF